MDTSINAHEKLADAISKRVWYEGTDALKQGEGVCYNTDYGTATAADARRSNRVERPSVSNNRAFAGVAARSYTASSTGQLIEIYVPGSKSVPVALGVDTVIDTALITFTVKGRYDIGVETGLGTEAGRFVAGRYRGRGSAIPRQTVTALLEASMTGGWLLAADGVTLTVVATAGLAAGDTVVIVGGEDDGTDAVVPGKYTISSITSPTVLVLTASAYDTGALGANATGQLTGYAYTGNPTALCDLLDGEESGGVEFMSVPNAGVVGMPYMASGLTYICGTQTIAADVDVTFAQLTAGEPFIRTGFICLGTLTTSVFTLDLATNGIQMDGSTALAEVVAFNAAGEAWFGTWKGYRWFTEDFSGCTEG